MIGYGRGKIYFQIPASLPPIKQGKLSAIIFKVILGLAKKWGVFVCIFVLFLFEFLALEVPIPSSLFEIQQSGNFKIVFFFFS